MLSEKEFYSYVEHHILEFINYPEEKEARVHRVSKNNQVFMTGLSIGRRDEHLQPILYLEPYYHSYFKGKTLEQILCEIGAAYEEYGTGFHLESEKMKSYEYIKKQLFFRLVSYEKNKEQLEDCPYERLEDLAVTYRWIAYRNRDGMASAVIRQRDLRLWGISEEQMKKDAMENTYRIFPPTIRKIQSVIPVHVEEGDIPIFVLSNGDYMNGASAMIYEGILKDFAERMESNLYILPSSIHEVILLLENDAGNVRELFQMVEETNRTVVDSEEVLSDSVYYYDREVDQITIAK